jgi:nicotinamide-nucleotide amidase
MDEPMPAFDGVRCREAALRSHLTLAVAESLTTGNLQAMIGATSGASSFFEGGITTYSLEQKVRFLDVDRAHAAQVNSVSQRVAEEMARGVCLRFDCDIGMGTTGYAEPDAANGVDAPFAYYAVWRRDGRSQEGSVVARERVAGDGLDREEMQRHVAEQALLALVRYMETLEAPAGADAA